VETLRYGRTIHVVAHLEGGEHLAQLVAVAAGALVAHVVILRIGPRRALQPRHHLRVQLRHQRIERARREVRECRACAQPPPARESVVNESVKV
jgi:hypothetical protein